VAGPDGEPAAQSPAGFAYAQKSRRPEPAIPERGAGGRARALRADEVAVLALLAEGLPLETVARQLAVSERTLRRRTRAICDVLGVPAAITAVAWAARRGLL
jgi:DNA-binding NarL/FixJ family response regulator